MTDMHVAFLILGVTIALFVSGRLPSDLIAIGSMLGLYLAGLVSAPEALRGFSNSTVILVGALFVVGEGLSRTGVTAWAGERLIAQASGSPMRLLVVAMIGTALLSAFISNTGTVATLMPAVAIAAWGVGSVPSAYLMPLAFAANAGGVLTLTGTPPNLVVAEALEAYGARPFEFFEYSLIGLPLLVVAVIYMATVGRRLLPERKTGSPPRALENVLEDLSATYSLDGELFRLHVLAGSPLAGSTMRDARIGPLARLNVLHVAPLERAVGGRPVLAPLRRSASSDERAAGAPLPDRTIEVDDVLVVSADPEAVHEAEVELRLGILPVEGDEGGAGILSRELGVAEIVLTPRSRFVGDPVTENRLSREFDVALLGGRRGDAPLGVDDRLRVGDVLLANGSWDDIGRLGEAHEDVVVVGRPEELSAQVTELSTRSWLAIGVLAGMVALMVSGRAPVAIAALIAAASMILSGCLTTTQAYRAVSWSTVMLIAGMLPMATALENTGGAKAVADALVATLGTFGPVAVLGGVFVVTTTLSQVMSNTATAVLMSPIVLTAAATLEVAPHPLMMAIAVAASTAFLTPIGTTTNLMVLSPGSYRFGDYAKVGGPLVAIFLAISLVLIPMIWPF